MPCFSLFPAREGCINNSLSVNLKSTCFSRDTAFFLLTECISYKDAAMSNINGVFTSTKPVFCPHCVGSQLEMGQTCLLLPGGLWCRWQGSDHPACSGTDAHWGGTMLAPIETCLSLAQYTTYVELDTSFHNPPCKIKGENNLLPWSLVS